MFIPLGDIFPFSGHPYKQFLSDLADIWEYISVISSSQYSESLCNNERQMMAEIQSQSRYTTDKNS